MMFSQIPNSNKLLLAHSEAVKGEFQKAIDILMTISSGSDAFEDAQYAIALYKREIIKGEAAEIQTSYPQYADHADEESQMQRWHAEAIDNMAAVRGDEVSMHGQFRKLINSPHAPIDNEENLQPLLPPVAGRYARIKQQCSSIVYPSRFFAVPAAVVSSAFASISSSENSQVVMENAYLNFANKTIIDMYNNCTFDPGITHLGSNWDDWGNALTGYKDKILTNALIMGFSAFGMLIPTFYFAQQYGNTRNIKYLFMALAFATFASGIVFTEDYLSKQDAFNFGSVFGYNEFWAFICDPKNKKGICSNSTQCDYDIKGNWENINNFFDHASPYKHSFFRGLNSWIVTLGCMGAVLLLGIISGYYMRGVKIVNINANQPQNYGSINQGLESQQPQQRP